MVFFDVSELGCTAMEFNDALMAHGIRVSTPGGTRCRALTHLDVSRQDVEEAVIILRDVAETFRKVEESVGP